MRSALLLCCLAMAAAAEPVDPATAYHAEETKAKEAYDAAVAKANAGVVKSLTALAQSAARKGDVTESAAAWKEVLRFDRENADARAFFTATGNLDQALADTATPRALPVPGAASVKMPSNVQAASISPSVGGERNLGAAKAGSTVLVQYVSGEWGRGRATPQAAIVLENPDDPASNGRIRCAIVDCSTQPPTLIATVPPGTATKPFAFQLPKDVAKLALWITPDTRQGPPRASEGSVNYKVAVRKP